MKIWGECVQGFCFRGAGLKDKFVWELDIRDSRTRTPPAPTIQVETRGFERLSRAGLQGYLARKKPRPPRTLQMDYWLGLDGGPEGGAASDERGALYGFGVPASA